MTDKETPAMADDTLTVAQARNILEMCINDAIAYVRGDSSHPSFMPNRAIDTLIAAVRAEEQQEPREIDRQAIADLNKLVAAAYAEPPLTDDEQTTIRNLAMLALSYGAGNAIDKKEAALRTIYLLVDPPKAQTGAPSRQEEKP